jgi:hypothetical protein
MVIFLMLPGLGALVLKPICYALEAHANSFSEFFSVILGWMCIHRISATKLFGLLRGCSIAKWLASALSRRNAITGAVILGDKTAIRVGYKVAPLGINGMVPIAINGLVLRHKPILWQEFGGERLIMTVI